MGNYRKTCGCPGEPVFQKRIIRGDGRVLVVTGPPVCAECLAPCEQVIYFSEAGLQDAFEADVPPYDGPLGS